MKKIQCDVCEIELNDFDWEVHIDTDEHKEKTLTQIMEDKIGKEISTNSRDETTEILEELEYEHKSDSSETRSD
ncbi:MAG: hypothetical protein ACQ9CV_02650 [Nitrosopumilus sp.]